MATTTNYSWTTPDDTDLVKDGAAAIRLLGSAIDSTVFTNAGNAINKSIVDAEGDLLVGDSADTLQRLAVGTTGQVLTVDTTLDGKIKWATAAAGAFTLISTTTMSGATTSLTSIPGTYTDLYLQITNWQPATNASSLRLRVNSDSNANRHYSATALTAANAFNSTSWLVNNEGRNTATNSLITIILPRYANTSTWKTAFMDGTAEDPNTPNYCNFTRSFGVYNQIGAVTSLDFINSSGNFTAGTIYLYGVK